MTVEDEICFGRRNLPFESRQISILLRWSPQRQKITSLAWLQRCSKSPFNQVDVNSIICVPVVLPANHPTISLLFTLHLGVGRHLSCNFLTGKPPVELDAKTHGYRSRDSSASQECCSLITVRVGEHVLTDTTRRLQFRSYKIPNSETCGGNYMVEVHRYQRFSLSARVPLEKPHKNPPPMTIKASPIHCFPSRTYQR